MTTLKPLTPKQERFVSEYLVDLNATVAAIRAGYSAKGAAVQGSKLLTIPKVSQAVAEGKRKQLARADLSASRVLEELRRVAFSDLGTLFTKDGKLKALHELTPEESACIASLEVIIKTQHGHPCDGAHFGYFATQPVWRYAASLAGSAAICRSAYYWLYATCGKYGHQQRSERGMDIDA